MHTFIILCILYYSLNSMFTIYKFLFTLFTGVLAFINKVLSGKQFLFTIVYYCLLLFTKKLGVITCSEQ